MHPEEDTTVHTANPQVIRAESDRLAASIEHSESADIGTEALVHPASYVRATKHVAAATGVIPVRHRVRSFDWVPYAFVTSVLAAVGVAFYIGSVAGGVSL